MARIENLLFKFVNGDYERNLTMAIHPLTISIYGHTVEVESIWVDANNDYYLHVGCKEFEGDLKILSLSDKNQILVMECVTANMKFEDESR